MKRLLSNPIIVREMRGRMRGRRAYVVLTIYLLLLSCIAGGTYTFFYLDSLIINPYNLTAPHIGQGPLIGKAIFSGIVLALLATISLMAPAFTAGAIAGERERKTYEILLVTPLRAAQIVWGKLGSVLTFLLLLIVASLPIQSLAFLFGGIELVEVIITALSLLVTALAFGVLGLFVSTLVRTTMTAIILTYGIGLLFMFGLPLMLFYVGFIVVSLFPLGLPSGSLPLGLLEMLIIYAAGFVVCINPFSTAILTSQLAADGKGYFFFNETFGSINIWFVSPWLVYVLFYTLLTLGLLWLTIRRVGTISQK